MASDRERLFGALGEPDDDLGSWSQSTWRWYAKALVLSAGAVALVLIAVLTISAVKDFDTVLLSASRTALYVEGILYAVVVIGLTWILTEALRH